MARKNYTQEFRRRAVDLYRSTPGAIPRDRGGLEYLSTHAPGGQVSVLDDEVDAGDRVPRVFTHACSCTGYLRAADGVRIDRGRYHGLEQAQPVETFQAPHGERMRPRQLGESHPEAVQLLALA